jgi:hypothetical protein
MAKVVKPIAIKIAIKPVKMKPIAKMPKVKKMK